MGLQQPLASTAINNVQANGLIHLDKTRARAGWQLITIPQYCRVKRPLDRFGLFVPVVFLE